MSNIGKFFSSPIRFSDFVPKHSFQISCRNDSVAINIESEIRAFTTGNIELNGASQAKQVKIVVMGAQKTGKTGT